MNEKCSANVIVFYYLLSSHIFLFYCCIKYIDYKVVANFIGQFTLALPIIIAYDIFTFNLIEKKIKNKKPDNDLKEVD